MEFGVLKRNFDELKDLGEKQEARLRYHESRAHNIAMAYLIWERCFFFCVSHTSSSSSSSLSLKCSNWSMVLGLSLSCSLLYFLFFWETLTMLYLAHYHLDIICKNQTQLYQQILDAVETSTEAGDSSDGFKFSFPVQVLEYHPFTILKRKFYIGSIVCALLAVTVFELYACKYSLCTN